VSENEAVAVTRIAAEVFARDGLGGWVRDIWHPDVELDFRPANLPDLGVFRGIGEAEEATREWAAEFDDWDMKLEAVIGLDDGRAYSEWVQTGSGRESGAPVEMHYAQIAAARDGKAISIEIYVDIGKARRAAGLDPV
jgi:ketosteroid isomerase-like protein